MEIKDMEDYEIERYWSDETKTRYYVVSGELSAADAVMLVANRLHKNSDRVHETRGYTQGNYLYCVGAKEKIPADCAEVWAITIDKKVRK